MLTNIRAILAVIALGLAVTGIIMNNFTLLPYELFFLAALLLVKGIELQRKGKKTMGAIVIFFGVLVFVVFILNEIPNGMF